MGYGHSLDLRVRIIEDVNAGASAREAARRFNVSASSAIKLARRASFGGRDIDLGAAIAVDRVVGAEGDPRDAARDAHATEPAGERLLADVGVHEHPGGENRAPARQHLPAVGVVVPTRIGVLHGDLDLVNTGRGPRHLGGDHVGLAGVGGGWTKRQERDPCS